MVPCFLVEGNSLLLKTVLSFFLLSNDIHKKNLTMTINTDAANMQKSNK